MTDVVFVGMKPNELGYNLTIELMDFLMIPKMANQWGWRRNEWSAIT